MSRLRDKFRRVIGAGTPSFGLGARFAVFNRPRLAAALAGVAVAVLVMFVELGLLNGIIESQSGIATLLRGDLVMMNAARTNLHEWTRIDPIRLEQAGAVAGVARVIPIYEGGMLLRNPPELASHRIVAFAFPADTLPLAIGDAETIKGELEKPDAVLYDSLSRPIYGSVKSGGAIELDGKSYDVGGFVNVGPDIVMDGAVVMSEGEWLGVNPGAQPIMGVIRLDPGADIKAAEMNLARALPPDISVMTPREAYRREVQFTFRSVPIGIIFGVGVATGVVIGAIICYQILFNEIVDMAREYATLRAMGFPQSFFRRIIFEQAYLLAFGGFLIGLVAAFATYRFLTHATGMAINLDLTSILLLFVPTIGMAHLGGVFAMRHLAGLEPADLY